MNTRKLRKFLLTLSCALLLVSLSVGITLAYLTDSESVTNTFTVGQVGICLDETNVESETDTAITDCKDTSHNHTGRDRANSYKLLPGQTYVKDPKIWVDSTSEEAYLRIKVTISNTAKVDALFKKHNIEDISTVLTGLDLKKWDVASNAVDNGVRTYVLNYKEKISGSTDPIEIFNKVVIPSTFDNEDIIELNTTTIGIVAEAIQSAGFETAEDPVAAAWAAFDTQKAAANQ